MSTAPVQYFEDLSLTMTDRIILLDVDGTLAPDGAATFSPAVVEQIRKLKNNNTVYLCTNTYNQERRRALASALDVPVLDSPQRKPSRQVVRAFDDHAGKFLVIGDKFLTDWLFAKNIGAEFIKVKRRISGQERWFIKIINVVDDVAEAIYTKIFVR